MGGVFFFLYEMGGFPVAGSIERPTGTPLPLGSGGRQERSGGGVGALPPDDGREFTDDGRS